MAPFSLNAVVCIIQLPALGQEKLVGKVCVCIGEASQGMSNKLLNGGVSDSAFHTSGVKSSA